jgi:hypothetical protein
MGIELFGVDIAGILHDAMSDDFPEMILTKNTAGARTPGSLTSGQGMTPASYSCNGFVDTYKEDEIDGTTVKKNDHKILIIGDSIEGGAVPEPGDTITAESIDFTIQEEGVERDPAAATYLCHCR